MTFGDFPVRKPSNWVWDEDTPVRRVEVLPDRVFTYEGHYLVQISSQAVKDSKGTWRSSTIVLVPDNSVLVVCEQAE